MAYIGKSPSNGIRNRFIYTATAGQTSFSGSDDHSRTLSYTDAEFMDVFLNGVKLDKSDYTATSGTSIVLGSAASLNDILEVLAFDAFSVFSGDFSQDVTIGADLTVDTDTLFVDASANKVGIGQTSISSDADRLHVDSSGTNSLLIEGTGSKQLFSYHDSAGVGWATGANSSFSELLYLDDAASAMRIYTNGAEAIRIDSSGNVGVGTDSPANNSLTIEKSGTARLRLLESGVRAWDIETISGSLRVNNATNSTEALRILSGGGLTFNGDTASANALDDYEEGTWTPTIATGTINSGNARYTKIGDLVHVTCNISNFSDRSTASNIRIGGLPFSSSSATNATSAVLGRYANVGGDAIVTFHSSSSTELFLYTTLKGGNYSVVDHNDLNSSSASFYISHTYKS